MSEYNEECNIHSNSVLIKLSELEVIRSYSNNYNHLVAVLGIATLNAQSNSSQRQVQATAYGKVKFEISPQNQSLIGRITNKAIKSVQLVKSITQFVTEGRASEEENIPFHINLISGENNGFYETYHGKYIKIKYKVKLSIDQNGRTDNLKREFVLNRKLFEYDSEYEANYTSESMDFMLDYSKSAQTNSESRLASSTKFVLTGVLDTNEFPINKPLTGQLTVVYSEIEVESVNIELLALETCSQGFKQDVSLIQVTQIVGGNISLGLAVPIFIVFPPLLTCPTVITETFKIEFAVRVVASLKNVCNVSKTIPIKIT